MRENTVSKTVSKAFCKSPYKVFHRRDQLRSCHMHHQLVYCMRWSEIAHQSDAGLDFTTLLSQQGHPESKAHDCSTLRNPNSLLQDGILADTNWPQMTVQQWWSSFPLLGRFPIIKSHIPFLFLSTTTSYYWTTATRKKLWWSRSPVRELYTSAKQLCEAAFHIMSHSFDHSSKTACAKKSVPFPQQVLG